MSFFTLQTLGVGWALKRTDIPLHVTTTRLIQNSVWSGKVNYSKQMAIISDPRGRLDSGTVIRNVYYYSKVRNTPRGAVYCNVYYSLTGCFFIILLPLPHQHHRSCYWSTKSGQPKRSDYTLVMDWKFWKTTVTLMGTQNYNFTVILKSNDCATDRQTSRPTKRHLQ